ncbi:MAG: PAS domain S-box protein [Deltaproteobacteria bacterium]|nr:MAG: PAS domain S-box protein [Deltaproteobacteria bacterium]
MKKNKSENPNKMTAEWQKFMNSAIESSISAIVITDINGNLTYVNNSFLKIWRYKEKKEVLGKRFVDFWQIRDRVLRVMGALREVDSWTGELTAKRKDGSSFDVHLDLNIVKDEAGKPAGMTGTFSDIAERKKVQEALYESEEKYRRFLENLADGCFVLDRNWRYIFINDAAAQLVKYTKSELLGNKITKLFPGIEDTPFFQAYRDTMDTGKTNNVEASFPHPDGTLGHYDLRVSAVPEGIVIIARDITEHKKADEEIKAEREKFETYIESMVDGLCVNDINGTIVQVNNAFIEMFGYKSPEEMVGKTIFEYVAEEEIPRITERFMDTVKNKESGISGFEVICLRKDGSKFSASFNIRNIWEKKEYIGSISVARDITVRKKAEEKLRLLSSAIEQSSEGVAVYDLKGNLLFFNNAFASMHGYNSEELVGKNLSILHTHEQMQSVETSLQQIKETGEFSGEIWHVRRDGTAFPGLMQNSLLRDEAGNPFGMIGTLRDITDLKRAEEALRKSEEMWHSVVYNAPNVILIADREGIIQFINRTIPGYTVEETIGTKVYDYIPSEYHSITIEYIKQTFQAGEPNRFEIEGYGPDGSIAWYEVQIGPVKHNEQVVAVSLITTDLTSRKLAEEALRASEEKWHSVVQNAPNVILIADREGIIQFINRTVPGYTVEETIGTKVYDYVTPEYHNIMTETIKQVFKSGESGKYESGIKLSDGSIAWYETQVGPVKHDDQIVAAVLITTDLTERKKAEAELLQAQKQRLASIGQLAAGVAHEINNPLMALTSEIQLWLEKTKDKELVESFNRINTLAKRIAGIVTDLVTFSRDISTNAREASDINSLIERISSLIEGRIQSKEIEIKKKLDENLPSLIIDKGQIQQAFMNIITNSLDATPNGGKLTISTKLSKTRDTVEITFRDNGSGIAEEDLPKVFDPFFTTKPPGKGVGMGLSVSYRIVENHGGSIKINSKLNEGTKVSIKLPVT